MTACGGNDGAQLGRGTGPSTTAEPGVSTSSAADPGTGPTSAPPATQPPGPGTTQPPAPATTPPRPTTAPRPTGLAAVSIKLTRIATFTEPVAMAFRPGDGALYIAEKRGRIRAFRGAVDPTPVLDIAGEVSTGSEQGLLGLAFSPDGKLYINFTDTAGDTHVVEYAMAGGAADPATRREVLFVDQPFANHNGGHLVFGPDGRLWIGLGDGGGGGDPSNNAQRLDTLLGKMLRIDPRPNGPAAYTVPGDNPFVGTAGARPEIWAYGLRNPWRYSFDRQTADLWIGDVGQNAREEVDFQPAGQGGQNYGWARLEGTRAYSGTPPANAVGPIIDYGRVGGNCAVTGGYVYRGSRIANLNGAYLYADYCEGAILALRQSGGDVVDQRAFSLVARNLTSFGEDPSGELYVLSQDGGIFRLEQG
ncbi:MAG: PQQ-dependent sugar dehydrogenase [Acidimicrobiales bacterium]